MWANNGWMTSLSRFNNNGQYNTPEPKSYIVYCPTTISEKMEKNTRIHLTGHEPYKSLRIFFPVTILEFDKHLGCEMDKN